MVYLSRFLCAALLALAVLSTASAGVNNPQSGWYSGNPLLGPNTLGDLACAGSTCYASGQFGTLLKSTDAGASWSGIVTGLTLNLTRVRLADRSPDHVVVGGGCAVRRSDDGGDTFFRLPFTARDTGCAAPLVSLSLPSDKTGYLLLANGRMLATADGGHSFSRRTPVPGGANDILCVADRTCFTVGASGIVQQTTDGAVSWTQVASFPNTSLLGLERADPLTLYAVGSPLVVLKSSDGGSSWTRKNVQNVPGGILTSIGCGDALNCLIATEQGNQVVRTTNGGDSFTSVVPSPDPTFAVAFASPIRAIVAGGAGSAEVSDDAGASWSAVGSRIAGSFTTLGAISDTVAYAGGLNGVLARTTDSGQTWSNVSPPTEQTIDRLTGWGADRVYVLAADGTLQRSDNGGASYRLLNYGTTIPAEIAAVGPDRLLLIGVPRGILRSENGGETFQRVQDRAVRRAVVLAADRAGGAVVVYGPRAAAISANGATGWRKIPLPRKRVVRDLDFATARLGFALDTRGSLWRTANGGRSWREVPSLGTSAARSLRFEDARNGYVAVSGFARLRGLGLVLRTADGGQSWHPQIVSRERLFSLAAAGSTGYALTVSSSLYATRAHGDIGAPRSLRLSAGPVSRAGAVVLRGRLSAAAGGEEVVVARYANGRWTTKLATASSNGAFSLRWNVRRKAVFVAQVLGDADHMGAGTPPLTVTVGAASRR